MRVPIPEWLIVAAAYWAAGKLGVLLAIPPGYATAIWPAAGIAIMAVLLRGPRIAPGIALGSFAINVATNGTADFALSAAVAASIGMGAAAEAVVGAALVRRFVGFPNLLIRELDIVGFLALGGPVACLVGATWGVATLVVAGVVDPASAPFSWWTWWVGDTVGVLIVAPLVLIWTSPKPQPRRRRFGVSVPLVLTFATAVTLFVYASRWEQARLDQDFERRTDEVAREVQREMHGAREMLRSVQGLFDSSDDVTRDEFRVFAQRLLSSDVKLLALSWIRRVPAAERAAFEAIPRGATSPGITELDAHGTLVAAAARAEHFAVDYVEPRNGNETVLGFDVGSDLVRRAALERARRSGDIVATAGVELVQARGHLGVSLLAPIYRHDDRHEILGFAGGVFHLHDMLQDALTGRSRGDLWMRLVDVGVSGGDRTLFDDRPTDGEATLASTPDRALGFAVSGRQWRLEFWPTPAYRAAHRSWEAWTVLAAGLLFTAVLGALLLVVTGRTAVVEGVVVQRTSELEHANRHLRTSDARTRLVLETMYDAFIAMDESGVITEWNRQAETTFGWTRAQAVGRTVADTIIPPALRDAHRTGVRRFLDTGRGSVLGRRIELTAIDARAREFPVEMTITPVKMGDAYTFSAFVHDISERTTAARELEVAKSAAEAAKGAAEIARTAAESANQAKSDFLASMSHELRTPMNSIIGFTQLLLRSMQHTASAEDVDALQTVRRNAKHLLTLINQILDLSKVEAGKVEIVRERFDVAGLACEIAAESRPLIGDKPIVLAVATDGPLVVDADPTQVRQIVTNLVANALKYTEEGRVDVAVTHAADPELGPVARIRVRDTGPGISPEDRARLFERFSRLDNPGTRRESGTGLGLNLARELARMHGGRIEVESDGRTGSEFTLVLPVEAPTTAHAEAPAAV